MEDMFDVLCNIEPVPQNHPELRKAHERFVEELKTGAYLTLLPLWRDPDAREMARKVREWKRARLEALK